jgi:hypothetical protein
MGEITIYFTLPNKAGMFTATFGPQYTLDEALDELDREYPGCVAYEYFIR